jgi:hypothetical protein
MLNTLKQLWQTLTTLDKRRLLLVLVDGHSTRGVRLGLFGDCGNYHRDDHSVATGRDHCCE